MHDSERATVTVAVRLVGEADRWLHVAVPVYRDGGQVGLAGTPALMAVPPAAEPLQARFGDVAVPDEVMSVRVTDIQSGEGRPGRTQHQQGHAR